MQWEDVTFDYAKLAGISFTEAEETDLFEIQLRFYQQGNKNAIQQHFIDNPVT